VGSNVINAAQEVVGVAMRLVGSTFGKNIRQAAGYFESVVTASQKLGCSSLHCGHRNEIPEFFAFMQPLLGLPSWPGSSFGNPRLIPSRAARIRFDRVAQFRPQLNLPDQGGNIGMTSDASIHRSLSLTYRLGRFSFGIWPVVTTCRACTTLDVLVRLRDLRERINLSTATRTLPASMGDDLCSCLLSNARR
jgi:hypothetical protein